MARPAVDFGTEAFLDLLDGCLGEVNDLMGNGTGRIVGYTSSGHGAWEATVTNLFDIGDRVLLCDTGLFSAKWGEMCEAQGLEVTRLVTGERHGVDPTVLAELLAADADHRIAGVLVCHTETSTGITSDLGAVRRALDGLGHPALLVVDAIASFATTPLDASAVGADAVLAASQKGLMMPVGLSFSGISPRAVERSYANERHRFYWDWRRRLEAEGYRKFCGTPPIHHLFALRAALDLIAAEGGLEAVVARHRRLAEAVRIAVEHWSKSGALELNALDPEQRADSVTCVRVGEGIDADRVVTIARERFDVTLGSGVGSLAGRSFRIGHLGDLNPPMVLGALGGIEASLRHAGVPIGSGALDAAAEHLAR